MTGCERKIGLLLIAIFERLFNPKNDGPLRNGWPFLVMQGKKGIMFDVHL